MLENDRLTRLMQSADAAATPPACCGDLPNRVRQRRSAQLARLRRIQVGTLAGVSVVLVAVALNSWKPPALPGGPGQADDRLAIRPRAEPGAKNGFDVERLRAESDALAAEADVLSRQIALTHSHDLRQQLREEHQSQLAAQFDRRSQPDSIDRAALVGLSQGDFYRDVRQSADEARAAYESVIDYFPDSQWAAIAQTKVNQLRMN